MVSNLYVQIGGIYGSKMNKVCFFLTKFGDNQCHSVAQTLTLDGGVCIRNNTHKHILSLHLDCDYNTKFPCLMLYSQLLTNSFHHSHFYKQQHIYCHIKLQVHAATVSNKLMTND